MLLVTADVGLARIMDASHMSTGIAPLGTFAYAAPELLMGRRCDEKVRGCRAKCDPKNTYWKLHHQLGCL